MINAVIGDQNAVFFGKYKSTIVTHKLSLLTSVEQHMAKDYGIPFLVINVVLFVIMSNWVRCDVYSNLGTYVVSDTPLQCDVCVSVRLLRY